MSIETHNENPGGAGARSAGGSPAVHATAAVRFRIGGPLRFLSHAETLRLFQRACSRAGVPVKYTEGFNPHPKLSLPLPRTVGVESDDELLVIRLVNDPGMPHPTFRDGARSIREMLCNELPDGIDVRCVDIVEPNATFRPCSVSYVFPLASDGAPTAAGTLKERIEAALASETLMMERRKPGRRNARYLDVRPFLRSIELRGDNLVIECNIMASGSIRVDEMMRLLDLRTENVAGPIRRTGVRWSLS